MPRYTIGAATFTDSGATDVHVKMTTIDLAANAEVTGDDSGGLYEEAHSLTGFGPTATLTSKALSTILGLIAIDGECIGATKDITQFDVISRKLETCEAALGGTPHMRHRVDTGILRLGTLTADRNTDATISVLMDAFTDGTNAPMAEADGVAMVTPLVDERYRLGLCKIAGVQFPDIEGISIEYNVSLTDKGPSLGSIWPDSAGVLTVRPVLVVRGRDLSKVQSGFIELGATAATHANTTLQFIKLENSGSYETFGDSVHISLTVAGMVVPEMVVSASAGGAATDELRVPLIHDGTFNPIVQTLGTTYNINP